MRNKSNTGKNFKRLVLSIALCIFLITSVSSTMIQDPIKKPNFISKTIASDIINDLTYMFSFTEPELRETQLIDNSFTKLSVPGTMSLGNGAGEPTLPVSFQKILLPPKTTIRSIEVLGAAIQIDTSINLIEQPILPYQDPVPLGHNPSEQIEFKDAVYESNDLYPSEFYTNQGIGYCRGYSIATIALQPVQYVPSSGSISYFPEMTIIIKLENQDEINEFYRQSGSDSDWVKNLVINPEIADLYTNDMSISDYPGGLCDPSDNYDYVIITTTHEGLDYWSTGGTLTYNWESLMDKHEQDDGLSCTLVTIQDIDACTDYDNADPLFNDLEAHIREFCKDAYEDWGTDYIFIGGDDEWIPARHMDTTYETDIDSDIYWSNLDLTFNDDEDYLWGEEGDSGFDLYAELFIG